MWRWGLFRYLVCFVVLRMIIVGPSSGFMAPLDGRNGLCFRKSSSVLLFTRGVPWSVGGDLNVVRCMEEKQEATSVSGSMGAFSTFIDEMELVDLPLQGGGYTWSGGRAMSRIDRFLVTRDWKGHFSHVAQLRLHHPVSDHWPILLDSGGIRRGLSPFQFEKMWLLPKGFREKVRGWWDSYTVLGNPSCRLAQKLKLLKSNLRQWNREVFRQLQTQKANILTILQGLDEKEDRGTLSEEDMARQDGARKEFGKMARMEDISFRQKSRC